MSGRILCGYFTTLLVATTMFTIWIQGFLTGMTDINGFFERILSNTLLFFYLKNSFIHKFIGIYPESSSEYAPNGDGSVGAT